MSTISDKQRVVVLVRSVDYDGNTEDNDVPGFHPEIYPADEVVIDAFDGSALPEDRCYYLEHFSPVLQPNDVVILERSDVPHTWVPYSDGRYDPRFTWKVVKDV